MHTRGGFLSLNLYLFKWARWRGASLPPLLWHKCTRYSRSPWKGVLGTNPDMLVFSTCVLAAQTHRDTLTHVQTHTTNLHVYDLSPSTIRGLSCLRNACCVFASTTVLIHISSLVFSFCPPLFLPSLLLFVLLPHPPPPAEKVTYCLQ